MRPKSLDEFVGQTHLVGKEALFRTLIAKNTLRSCIFWGPPGVGKTTLARIVSSEMDAEFVALSGVSSGKAELLRVVKTAQERLQEDRQTILFIDEIHRWNKAQQDALLPFVEQGTVILIGATTENPSFEVVGALLSRSQVLVFEPLSEAEILQVLEQALQDSDRGMESFGLSLEPDALQFLAEFSGGDVRQALNALELAILSVDQTHHKDTLLSKKIVQQAIQKSHVLFDKHGEQFYNIISALHKSMRGGDANAALYWLARMLEGGVDPLYIARRVIRFASEDIGMANSEALIQANAAYDAAHKIGMPECSVNLAQAVVYCAKSAKSNRLYTAYKQAAKDAQRTSHLGVPFHIRNAPTKLMKELGYGKGYQYNPDFEEPVDQDYLPEELKGRDYLK